MKIFSATLFLLLLSIASNSHAYVIYERDSKGFIGACDNGKAMSGGYYSPGYYVVMGPYGNFSGQDADALIKKACGE